MICEVFVEIPSFISLFIDEMISVLAHLTCHNHMQFKAFFLKNFKKFIRHNTVLFVFNDLHESVKISHNIEFFVAC